MRNNETEESQHRSFRRIQRNSDVLINEGMTVDEVTLKIEMYGAELTVSGSSPEHLAHVVKSLNLVLGGLK